MIDEQLIQDIDDAHTVKNQKYTGTHILEHDAALLKLANRLEHVESMIGVQKENTYRGEVQIRNQAELSGRRRSGR